MQVGVGVLFLLLTIAWTGVLWWVATRSGQAVPYERVSAVISRIRRWGAPRWWLPFWRSPFSSRCFSCPTLGHARSGWVNRQ
jgi:hypothetical protein